MSDIQPTAARAADPARIVTEAIRAAFGRRLRLSTTADLGVMCTSTHAPAWAVDPRCTEISPLGAVLLDKQPEVNEPVAALVLALGVGSRWQDGFDHGLERRPPAPKLLNGLDGRLYSDGYIVGTEARALIHRYRGLGK